MSRTIKNNKIIVNGIYCLLFCCNSSFASDLNFKFRDGTKIAVSPTTDLVQILTAEVKEGGPALKKELINSEDAFVLSQETFIIDGKKSFPAVVRKPSVPNNPGGRCGAGHEDYILLVSIDKGMARLEDKIIIQSCLTDISLVSDQGTDPQVSIIPLKYPQVAQFQATAPPDFQIKERKIFIKDGKLKITE